MQEVKRHYVFSIPVEGGRVERFGFFDKEVADTFASDNGIPYEEVGSSYLVFDSLEEKEAHNSSPEEYLKRIPIFLQIPKEVTVTLEGAERLQKMISEKGIHYVKDLLHKKVQDLFSDMNLQFSGAMTVNKFKTFIDILSIRDKETVPKHRMISKINSLIIIEIVEKHGFVFGMFQKL